MLFRTRDLFVGQRTQLINALRGHLAEHGLVAPQGPAHLKRLADALADESSSLCATVRDLGAVYLGPIATLDVVIAALDKKLREAANNAETVRRLQTMPGVGPVTAVAIETLRSGHGEFPPGTRLCSVVGAGPASTLHRWEAAARKNIEDGAARHPQAAHHRSHGRGSGGGTQRRAGRQLAGAHAGKEAEILLTRRTQESTGPHCPLRSVQVARSERSPKPTPGTG